MKLKGWLRLVVILVFGLIVVLPALAADQPRYGGTLRAAIAGDAPSLDPHRETTFKTIQVVAPAYNTLLMFSPTEYPKIIGDLATDWSVSKDGLTYTFKLHKGVRFHDGSLLTSADVKASFEKIIWPPKGTFSSRKAHYRPMERIETPDADTVVFTLKHPSASMLANFASPWNVIYAKKHLDENMKFYERKVIGTGPFKFKKDIKGSTFELVKNENYFRQGRPYLDGVKFFMIKDLSARAKSLRSGRVDIEFRNMPPAEVETMKKQLGDRINVQYPGWVTWWGVSPHNTRKPFDDVRVRKALSLAIDRYDMAKTIYPLTGLEGIGGMMRPGSAWQLSSEEMQQLTGYGKDHQANVKEAKRLLAEAGYPNGFKVILTNRSVKLPYIDFGVYLISAWKKIGVDAEHLLQESATWSKTRNTGDFALMVNPGSDYTDEPDIQLSRYISGSPSNSGRISDPRVDELFKKQAVETDPKKRIEMVKEIQKIIINNAYYIQGLWSARAVVHSHKVRNYVAHPSHYSNQRLQDVWLAK
ncbi:MAG: ABC transporter substrate-binding protein [bacterium]|nr:ABC transporter substrate-binding protein [bacterium]